MEQALHYFSVIGSEWVLWLLVALSVASIALTAERVIALLMARTDVDGIMAAVVEALNRNRWDEALAVVKGRRGVVPAVLAEGLKNADKGPAVAEELMVAQQAVQRSALMRGISFLGTVGANAPFVGLLGTVLGIMRAFKDLASTTEQGPSVVMAGIAEALVATAIGLLVAIPAVVAFNYLRNWASGMVADADRVTRVLLAFIRTRQDKG